MLIRPSLKGKRCTSDIHALTEFKCGLIGDSRSIRTTRQAGLYYRIVKQPIENAFAQIKCIHANLRLFTNQTIILIKNKLQHSSEYSLKQLYFQPEIDLINEIQKFQTTIIQHQTHLIKQFFRFEVCFLNIYILKEMVIGN